MGFCIYRNIVYLEMYLFLKLVDAKDDDLLLDSFIVILFACYFDNTDFQSESNDFRVIFVLFEKLLRLACEDIDFVFVIIFNFGKINKDYFYIVAYQVKWNCSQYKFIQQFIIFCVDIIKERMDQSSENSDKKQPFENQSNEKRDSHNQLQKLLNNSDSSDSLSQKLKSAHRLSSSSSDSEIKQQNKSQKSKENEKKKDVSKKIRYKYCCKICKHTDPNKKACVCVVPLGQRRTQIGSHGCQTCGCNGCSKEDFISRGQDPQYHPGDRKKTNKKQGVEFEARNGCCRNCMKAFSKTNKSCLCQVPQNVRNTKLPSSGCKICGCFGCNPQDKKQAKNKKSKAKQRSRSRDKRKKRKHEKRQKSQSSNSRQYIDSSVMNFNNVDKSVIGAMMVNQYRLDPALLGFGIPQRTYSYLTGKPK